MVRTPLGIITQSTVISRQKDHELLNSRPPSQHGTLKAFRYKCKRQEPSAVSSQNLTESIDPIYRSKRKAQYLITSALTKYLLATGRRYYKYVIRHVQKIVYMNWTNLY